MKSGDLVELCGNGGGLRGMVCVAEEGGEQQAANNRYIATGTLAVYLKKKTGAVWRDPAVVILVNGQPGWVWQNEIKPATCATATGL